MVEWEETRIGADIDGGDDDDELTAGQARNFARRIVGRHERKHAQQWHTHTHSHTYHIVFNVEICAQVLHKSHT